MGLQHGPGVFLSDEVVSSTNPAQHAADLISTMRREKIQWVAQQITTDDRYQLAHDLLKKAAADQSFGSVGTWAQGLPAAAEFSYIRDQYKPKFHICNIESPHEDAQWSDSELNLLVALGLPDGYGVIFTEGAWGQDSAKSLRWRQKGFVGIPEAIESENSNATIGAMMDLAVNKLGWQEHNTNVCLYFTRGFRADGYEPEINTVPGRWSIFRYGDIGSDDWAIMSDWERVPPTAPTPPPDLPPVEPPVPELRTGAEQAAAILAILAEPTKDGGLYTNDTRAIIGASRASWFERMEYVSGTVTDTQRIVIAGRIADADNEAWKVAGPKIDKILKESNL
jgi:hypothetical protein